MNQLKLNTIIPTTLGTALEWAEYTFFAYMTNQLATLFFPVDNPKMAILKTYGVFATSYFIRPLGAILFGRIGDKLGRKPALISSMLLMCLATTAIGFLPTYISIGTLAPVLLIFCRLLQGLAVAGEFNGSAVFMLEHNPKRPFFAGALTPFAAASGMSIGSFASMLVSLPNAPSFAWRIPFLCSGVIGLLALYLRQQVSETPVFRQNIHTPKKTFYFFMKEAKNRMAFLSTIAISVFISVYIYIGNVYYKTLSTQLGGLHSHVASQIITFGQMLSAILILVFGVLADRFDGKKYCLIGLSIAVLLGPLILACGQSGNIPLSILGQIFYAVINGMVSATMMTLMIKKFPPEIRYSGNSLAWSLPTALFGGTALIAAEGLVDQFGFMGPGLYISLAGLFALIITRMDSPD